ncbi:hypothetical protein [Profundibacter sp.]
MSGMKQLAAFTVAACLVLSLTVSPATAEAEDKGEVGEGLSLMEEGAKLLFRGLMDEMEPALEDLQGLADEMAPAFAELMGMIGDFTNYHAPEVLPNGDIIIRRKVPLKVELLGEGEIEL